MLLAADTRPAGGAAIGEVILATALGAGLTALLLGLVFLHRTRRTRSSPGSAPGWARPPACRPGSPCPTVLTTLSLLRRPARDALGHQPAHRRRPGRGPAGQPRALPDPVRPVRRLRRRRARLLDAAGREAGPGRRPLHQGLGRARRRHPAHRRRLLRPARLPAGRRLAPPLRPGRDAVGPDPPDAHHRRRAVDHRPADPRAGGPRRAVHRRRRPEGRAGSPASSGRPRPWAGCCSACRSTRASSTSTSRSSAWSSSRS